MAEASLNDDKKAEEQVVQFRDIVKQQLAEEVKTRVDDTVRKKLQSQVGDELDDVYKVVTESTEHAEQIRIKRIEQADIESRQCNIILYKVPESTEVLAQDRKKYDSTFCEQFLNSFKVGVDREDIRRMQRFGIRTDEGG